MRKSLNTFALAGAGMAFAVMPVMASGQDEPMSPPTSDSTTDTAPAEDMAPPQTRQPPTPEQDAMMQGWPADRQAAFKAWPADTQSYYWSLPEERQKIFWALSDSDKVTLSQMPEAQRESTWVQIESRTAPPRS